MGLCEVVCVCCMWWCGVCSVCGVVCMYVVVWCACMWCGVVCMMLRGRGWGKSRILHPPVPHTGWVCVRVCRSWTKPPPALPCT